MVDRAVTPLHPTWIERLLLLLGLVSTLIGFGEIAASYDDFLLPQQGVTFVPERELAFYGYYTLCGSIGFFCAARLLMGLPIEAHLKRLGDAVARRARLVCGCVALWVFGASALFRVCVLEGQPLTDDEGTYLFIARTLLQGRLINPVPAIEPELFRNQFIVLSERGWYGKYPIGHPALLALGEWVHLRDLIMPLVAAACVPLSYALGRRWFGDTRALVGTALLAFSPHFVGTAGTLLSQPTSCLLMLLGVWLMLLARDRDSSATMLLSGAAFGWGLLTRPLPGALFALVAVSAELREVVRTERAKRMRAALRALPVGLGATAGVLALAAVNYVQTGDPLSSGYHQAHGSVVVFNNEHADIANSIFGALMRENFWLLGVPCALVPVAFARPRESAGVFWGLLAAELAYRVISPKTVVATTGPIYLTEVVPLLLLGFADGCARIRSKLSRLLAGQRIQLLPAALAGLVIAGTMFVPVQWRTIRRAVEARLRVFRELEQRGATRALVFTDAVVHPASVDSWAYFPDNPSPDLHDDIVFVRVPKASELARARALWLGQFEDHRAFAFTWSKGGQPVFEELAR